MPVDSPEDLYGLPLDRFIPERAALVKALRGEKRREEASEVAALRKPSVAAWAVNQLVRTQPKALEALFGAGEDLAQAQARAAAGKGGADAMRDATRRHRDAVRELLGAAEGLLSSEGHALSQTMIERVAETLRAAGVDEEARRQVAGGCLTHELRFAGVGIGGLVPSSVNTKPRGREKTEVEREATGGEGEAAGEAEAARDAGAEREAARERAAALKAARQTEAETRRVVTRAHKELAAAQARREEAAASLQEAETRLSAAAQRAEEAQAKLTTVEAAVRDLAET